MTRIAVVILNYNGEALLRQFLPSVIQHTPGAEIIVADNASTDNSLTLLNETFPEVRVIRLDRNFGFCGGYNRAMLQVDTDIAVLLNSDVEVTPGWLEPMVGLLERDAGIAAVQPKILSYREKEKFEHAGAGGGFIDALGYPFCRGRVFNLTEVDQGQYNNTREVFWASGACFVVRKPLFMAHGGFDEDFFAHMEEIDLCWKLQRSGYHIYYCGNSKVYHLGGGTLAMENPGKTYLNFRNGLFLVYRHWTSREIIWKLPLRIAFDLVASIRFLAGGSLANARAVWKAHAAFISAYSRERKKRNRLKRHAPFRQMVRYSGVLPVRFFLIGNKSPIGNL